MYVEVFYWIMYQMYNVHQISAADWVQKQEREKTSSQLFIYCQYYVDFRGINSSLCKLWLSSFLFVLFRFFLFCWLQMRNQANIYIGIRPSSNQKMIRSIEKNARQPLYFDCCILTKKIYECVVCWNANKTVYVLINKVE